MMTCSSLVSYRATSRFELDCQMNPLSLCRSPRKKYWLGAPLDMFMRSDSPTCSGSDGLLAGQRLLGSVSTGSSGAKECKRQAKDSADRSGLPHVDTSKTRASSVERASKSTRPGGGGQEAAPSTPASGPDGDPRARSERGRFAQDNAKVESESGRSRTGKEKSPEAITRFGALVINLATTYSPTHARAQYHRLWRA